MKISYWLITVLIAVSSSLLTHYILRDKQAPAIQSHVNTAKPTAPILAATTKPEVATPAHSSSTSEAPQSALNVADMLQLSQQLSELKQRITALEQQQNETKPRLRRSASETVEIQKRNLLQAGVDPVVVEQLQQWIAAQDLQRLEIRDQAAREGWLNSERFFEANRDWNEKRIQIRDEIGDAAYDQYLYLNEDDNRLRIDSVMAGSAAADAGLQPGDLVLSYDGTRMFHYNDLTSATTDGNREDWVEIKLQRGSETLSFWIPRGPIGVRLESTRIKPE